MHSLNCEPWICILEHPVVKMFPCLVFPVNPLQQMPSSTRQRCPSIRLQLLNDDVTMLLWSLNKTTKAYKSSFLGWIYRIICLQRVRKAPCFQPSPAGQFTPRRAWGEVLLPCKVTTFIALHYGCHRLQQQFAPGKLQNGWKAKSQAAKSNVLKVFAVCFPFVGNLAATLVFCHLVWSVWDTDRTSAVAPPQ